MNIKIMGPSGVTKIKDEAKKKIEATDLRKKVNIEKQDFRNKKKDSN